MAILTEVGALAEGAPRRPADCSRNAGRVQTMQTSDAGAGVRRKEVVATGLLAARTGGEEVQNRQRRLRTVRVASEVVFGEPGSPTERRAQQAGVDGQVDDGRRPLPVPSSTHCLPRKGVFPGTGSDVCPDTVFWIYGPTRLSCRRASAGGPGLGQ